MKLYCDVDFCMGGFMSDDLHEQLFFMMNEQNLLTQAVLSHLS